MPHRNSHSRSVLVARMHAPCTHARTYVRLYAWAGYALSRLRLSLCLFSNPTLSPPVFLANLSLALPHSCHAARISDNRVGLRKKTPSGSMS